MVYVLKSRLFHAAIVFVTGFIACLIFQWLACQAPEPVIEPGFAGIRISPQTYANYVEKIDEYERQVKRDEAEIDKLEDRLLAAVNAQFTVPTQVGLYDTTQPAPGFYSWTWGVRGGGTGCFDYGAEKVEMAWNPWTFGVGVEFFTDKQGRIGGVVTTDSNEVTLDNATFYADDLTYKKKWYQKFNAGIAGGYGDGLAVMGSLGWNGWNGYVYHDRDGETYMFGKTVTFF